MHCFTHGNGRRKWLKGRFKKQVEMQVIERLKGRSHNTQNRDKISNETNLPLYLALYLNLTSHIGRDFLEMMDFDSYAEH